MIQAVVWLLLSALLASCSPSIADQKQQLLDRISVQEDSIRAIEADAMRRHANAAAREHELAAHSDILRASAETDQKAEIFHSEIDQQSLADHRAAVERLRHELAALDQR